MPMNVMHVRGVRVGHVSRDRAHANGCAAPLLAHPVDALVLMMFVMDMRMGMRRWLVEVFVLVPLRHVKPHT